MKNHLPLFAAGLALLFSACSKDDDDAAVTPDSPLPQVTLERRSLVLDNASFPFIRVPLPSGGYVWMGETELTVGHYTRIMGPSLQISNDPKPLTWFQAALYTNLLSRTADSLLSLSGDTLLKSRYQTLKDKSHGFTALYDTSAGSQVFKPPVVRIAALAFAADTSWRFPSDTSKLTPDTLRMSPAASGMVYRSRLCSLVMEAGAPRADRIRVLTALLAQKPDSLFSSSSPAAPMVFLPHELRNGTALAALLDDSSAHTLTAFKHSFRLAGDSITNAAAVPDTLFNTAQVRIVKADTLLQTTARSLRLFYFETIPPDSLFKTLAWAISSPAPCTVYTHPKTYTVRVWKRNPAAWGFRLPTNAEWEAAARCGQSLAYSTVTGKLTLTTAVYNAASFMPVRSMEGPNPYGLYDMTGNLAEWITDYWTQYGAYLMPDTASAVNLSRVPHKVVKGGHFACANTDSTLLTTTQLAVLPDSLFTGRIGLRLAVSADSLSDTLWNALPR